MVEYEKKCSELTARKEEIDKMTQILGHQEDQANSLINLFIDYQEKKDTSAVNPNSSHHSNKYEDIQQLMKI